MNQFTITITEADRLLVTDPSSMTIGSKYDDRAQELVFVRPDGRENDDLILYIQAGRSGEYKQNLGDQNSFVVTNAFTQWPSIQFQVAFVIGGVETEHSTITKLSFRDSLSGSAPPPDPLPDFWRETSVEAWWGQPTDEGGYLSVKNSIGQEITQLPMGGGGGGVSKSYVDQQDAATLASANAYTDANKGVTVHGQLTGRDAADQHPVGAIAGLVSTLAGKASSADLNIVSGTAANALSAANAAQQTANAEVTAREASDDEFDTRLDQLASDSEKYAVKTEVASQIQVVSDEISAVDTDLQGQIDTTNSGVAELQAQVNSMSGGAVYLERFNVPTASITQAGLDAWAVSQGYSKPFKSNITIIDADNHEWAYNADLLLWVDTGVFTSSTATQTSLGIVKGTTAQYGMSVNAAGEMTLNTGGKLLTDVNFTSEKDDKLAGIAENAKNTTLTSQLVNNSGFAYTSDPRFTDARPASDVSAWAKAATKPGYTKAEVGLGSVDNTADMDKPVSTATQTALAAKLPIAGGTMSGALVGQANTNYATAQMRNVIITDIDPGEGSALANGTLLFVFEV